MTTTQDFNSLARILKNSIPDLQSNHDPMYTAAILMTYARLWNDKEHFDHIDECSSLKSLYRTALGAIAGGIHPENQEKTIQWTISQTSCTNSTHRLAPRIQDFANHAQDMMDCLFDIGHAERFPSDSPPSPAEYFNLRATNTEYPEPIPMPNGYNRWYLDASSFPPYHIGCGLATPSLLSELLPPDHKCPGCQELEAGTGGENQLGHMVPARFCLQAPTPVHISTASANPPISR